MWFRRTSKLTGKIISQFMQLEASAGTVLLFATFAALLIANSPLYFWYQHFFDLSLSVHFGPLQIKKSLLSWINEGFMTLFFLLLGLEIKREILEGELNSIAKSALPAFAAVGGMLIPALIYILINRHDSHALSGWAIPCATDTAFSLGILAFLGKRIPSSLKIFLTAVAIFDDIGAIVVIAVFYTDQISTLSLVMAAGCLIILFLFNQLKISRLSPYLLVGVILWICVLKSGVHATLAGIVIALAIPLKSDKHPTSSPLLRLERQLHPWVAFGILPLFAFANAGLSLLDYSTGQLMSGITWGIAVGLFVGKQIGIWGISTLAIKCGLAKMPRGATSFDLYGVAIVAGIGFTMSLFIGNLAFGDSDVYDAQVRLGVILGSLLSGIIGYLVLRRKNRVA